MRVSCASVLFGLLACGGESPPTFDLEGRQLDVSDGSVRLREGERALLGLSGAITVRTFRETSSGSLGIWDFRRREEMLFALEPGAPTVADGSITIPYAGEGMSGRLQVDAESAERTRFRFTLEGEASSIAIPVACDADGSFHGFGVQYDATDQRGEAFDLMVTEQGIGRQGRVRALEGDAHTTYFPMPYWLDGRGFGVLMRTDERVHVDLCAANPEVASIEVISGEPVEWVVYGGPTPLDVVRQLGDEVGRPAPLPEWAFGLWIGSQGGRDAVLAEVDALEAADIPVAAFWVQDWTGIRMNFGGGFGVEYRWEADDLLYPDLAGMVSGLHDRGYRFLAYANPFVDPDLPNHFAEMDAAGLLLRNPEGESYVFASPSGTSAHPDLTDPAARAYVQDALRSMIRDLGIDSWMQDFGEWTPLDAVGMNGEGMTLHNRFPILWQQMAREAFDAERPDGDYAFFGRSGWTGVQGVAQIHWIGDQEATFEVADGLPTVVPAMLGLGLSAQPNVTHDVAGFSGGPSSKELFMRWTELGAFTPIFRTHEGNRRDDNWSWEKDAETTAHFRRFARIHEALRPLLQAAADASQVDARPIVRHLMLEFPDDRRAWEVDDEFLLGATLLVAPVTGEGQTTRSVYLPEGAWFHVWTGERFDGPSDIEVPAPLGSPPVFSRAEDRPDLRAIE